MYMYIYVYVYMYIYVYVYVHAWVGAGGVGLETCGREREGGKERGSLDVQSLDRTPDVAMCL